MEHLSRPTAILVIALLCYFCRKLLMNLAFGQEMNILNKSSDLHVSATDVDAVDASMQKMILRLKGKYLSEDGKSVDYSALRNDDLFKEFQLQSEQLASVVLANMRPVQRKAFFINVYNTLTIHGLVKMDPLPKSLLDVNNFWKHTAYNINGMVFSLDDIEHGILRANTRHPSAISKPFKDDDPRLPFSMTELDPRIHFSLNCGGQSCPAIAAYTEINLETALHNAATNFLLESVQIHGNTIHLSKLFLWYGSDFGSSDEEILRWICAYLPDNRKGMITELLNSNNFKIVHDEYNWLINTM